MEILKYLDVLIGLALVMVLLSPLVTTLTQVVMWLSNARATRLGIGLGKLILELNGNPFEQFDSAAVTGVTSGAEVALRQPSPLPALRKTAGPDGTVIFTENVPAMLAETGGHLDRALEAPSGAAITLRARGADRDWKATSPPTNEQGKTSIPYKFVGPPQFASYEFEVNPKDVQLTIAIEGGPFAGNALELKDGHFVYPEKIRPVPCEHTLVLTVTRDNQPVANQAIELTFKRSRAFDQPNPVEDRDGFTDAEAMKIAELVLLHPLVAQPKLWLAKCRKGEVVEREEFIRLLLGFAANPDPKIVVVRKWWQRLGKKAPNLVQAAEPLLFKLRRILAKNQVGDPGRAIADIREMAQRLELAQKDQPTHERLTNAILLSVPSAFVGRINNWFDHVMDRTTAEYRFRAQLVTVGAALLVAVFLQMDSLDLLKRLSVDDKLRDSLVKQAEMQEKRLQQPTDEAVTIKAKRDEIEANLAKLQEPQLSILPDHFLWQRLPQARLLNNPDWGAKRADRFELIAGGNSYPIQIAKWSAAPLDDLESAIRDSGAPVKVTRDRSARTAYLVTNPKGLKDGLAEGLLTIDGQRVHLPASGEGVMFDNLLFTDAKVCGVRGAKGAVPCDAKSVASALTELTYTVVPQHDDVVVTAKKMGPLQLRFTPGNATSNMLNSAEEWSSDRIDWDLLSRTWRGVLLTWILLSLGAPFWYDSLKDLLKLRSTLAKKEEDARVERQTATPPGAAAGK